jgi:hypothetical protein
MMTVSNRKGLQRGGEGRNAGFEFPGWVSCCGLIGREVGIVWYVRVRMEEKQIEETRR